MTWCHNNEYNKVLLKYIINLKLIYYNTYNVFVIPHRWYTGAWICLFTCNKKKKKKFFNIKIYSSSVLINTIWTYHLYIYIYILISNKSHISSNYNQERVLNKLFKTIYCAFSNKTMKTLLFHISYVQSHDYYLYLYIVLRLGLNYYQCLFCSIHK